ncbi:unnamed protein product [Meloidogyne enterolobii]|uniref:Uncharacterized protein n=1 Tax=Meloidogyne enterolobii TaxID=390850 RepID=A0ACB1BBL5_MELEN
MDELMETTKDDPLAMLHPSGKYVKSIMHFQARLQRKHEPFPGQSEDVTGSPYTEEQVEVPDQYKCFLCKGLLRDAVLAACCGHSFCAECYQQQLLANPLEQCPGPDCSQQISADSLIPNKSLRAAIQKYLNELQTGGETTDQQTGGVNKPSVLTDTQSLLHKLMPDLALAQAQRELATTTGPSVAATNIPASIVQPPPSKPPPIFIGLKNASDPLTSSTVNVTTQDTSSYVTAPALSSQPASINNIPAASTASSLQGAPLFLPQIPIFDPKRPPPPINIPISAAQNVPITPPIISSSTHITAENGSVSHVSTSINTAQQKGLVSASPLSAQELSSVWENFLKRKDKDSAAKSIVAAAASSGQSGGGYPSLPPMSSASSDAVIQSQQRTSEGLNTELRPPGSVTPVSTTGLVPPGIGQDHSSIIGSSISSNLLANIGGVRPLNPPLASNIPYQSTTIRPMGPHVPDSEITQVWLSFLRMKDSQQQNRQYKKRYSISPERRTPSPQDQFSRRSRAVGGNYRRRF